MPRTDVVEPRPLGRAEVIDAMPIAMVVFDRDGRYVDVNAAAERLIGHSRVSLLGKTNWELFPDTLDGPWHLAFLRVAKTEQSETVTSYYPAWDRWYDAMLSATASRVVCVFMDSTERDKTAAQLETANNRWRAMFMAAPVSVVVWAGPEHRCVLYNDHYAQLTDGRARVGSTLLELFPELAGHPIVERLARVYATGEGDDLPEAHIPLRTAEGVLQDRWFSTSWRAMRDSAGAVYEILSVGIEVTEQVYARRAVDAACAVAETASREKDQFLAMLGHELRNPLSPIMSALDILRLRNKAIDDTQEFQVLDRQARSLSRLVDDLLDISRISRGKLELQRENVELSEVIARAVESVAPLIHARGHSLEVDVAAGHWVHGDPMRLRQLFANLLTNAAKYTDPGGRIQVVAGRDEGEIVIEVTDTGRGISSEMLPSVFDLFTQERQNLDRSEGGLGLGLAIVKHLADSHGGSVSVRSDGPRTGSSFFVRLPAGAAPHDDVASHESRSHAHGAEQVSRRILLVEDNVDAASQLAESLRLRGMVIEVAQDGQRALQCARASAFDAAVVDIGLPFMDGYELARALRKLPGWEGVPLIALTGYGQERDHARAMEAGFDRHLVKPAMATTLLDVIEEVVRGGPAGC